MSQPHYHDSYIRFIGTHAQYDQTNAQTIKGLLGNRIDGTMELKQRAPIGNMILWNEHKRLRHDGTHCYHACDVTDAQWQIIEPLLPVPKKRPGGPGGRRWTGGKWSMGFLRQPQRLSVATDAALLGELEYGV